MNGIRRLLMGSMVLLLFMVLLVGPVLADSAANTSTDGGTVLIGQDWTLPAGETYRGDVVIISADATVEEGATLVGDLAVISGDANVYGAVQGDVAVVSGNVYLGSKSFVAGDVALVLGEYHGEAGAVVQGDIVHSAVNIPLQGVPAEIWPQLLQAMRWANVYGIPQPGSPQWFVLRLLRLIGSIVGAIVTALVLAAIAALLTAVWPEPMQRVAETAEKVPVPGFLIGLSVSVTVLLVAIILTVTICLSPFAALLVFGLVAAGLMGWTAIGGIVGRRLWDALNQPSTSDVLPTAVGTFVISLLAAVPCVGTLFGLLVGTVGLGAVVLSHFGTRVPDTI